jgi:hypothetical protein
MPAPTLPGCTERYDFLLGRAVQGDVVLVRGEVDLVQVHVSTVPRPALHQPPDTGSQAFQHFCKWYEKSPDESRRFEGEANASFGIKVFLFLSCVRI